MKEVSENIFDIKEILYKQLGLLAKESEKGFSDNLPELTNSMLKIAIFLIDNKL